MNEYWVEGEPGGGKTGDFLFARDCCASASLLSLLFHHDPREPPAIANELREVNIYNSV